MRKIDAELQERLSLLIGSMGYELLGCEFLSQGGSKLLRLYIDSPKGVSADDCSRVSHQVSATLDVEDPFQSRYVLEVSSPGIDRPLFELKHFERFVGSEVKIRLYAPIAARKQFKGTIAKVAGEDIHVFVDELKQEIVIPFSAIERANVIGKVHF
jgi:ribosome maturation factor RimP